jgi:enoyl-CoA hydratase
MPAPWADGALLVDIEDRIAVLTLHRPDVRNALTPALASALMAAVGALEADDEVDALILTGADPAFCAGLDLKEAAHGLSARPPGRGPFGPRAKLLIGAVNGAAVTGGLELALNCDFLIASDRARFADTHARVGVQPGWGLTVLLSRAVGVTRARQMSLVGEYVDAATADRWGLVNQVVAHHDLLPVCRRLAASYVATEQVGARRLLRTYADVFATTVDEAWEIEAEVNRHWLEHDLDVAGWASRHADVVRHGRRQIEDGPTGRG